MNNEKWKPIKRKNSLPQKFYSSTTFFDVFFDLLEKRSLRIELPDFVSPQIDILESSNSITLEIELPGMLAGSFAYKVEGDLIHIRGEKHRTSALLDGTYTRMERRYGLFARTFRLPAEVIANQTKTFYENGVMKIALFKKREPESEADEEAFAGF